LKLLELTLGILTAVGGFVDISELVFAAQGGSRYGYRRELYAGGIPQLPTRLKHEGLGGS
jgi:hypothetical protein